MVVMLTMVGPPKDSCLRPSRASSAQRLAARDKGDRPSPFGVRLACRPLHGETRLPFERRLRQRPLVRPTRVKTVTVMAITARLDPCASARLLAM